jgi:8-oxo-dGTP pyrophosphatase MutT (NUDIX family)
LLNKANQLSAGVAVATANNQQGMSYGGAFAPGVPLTPFDGYSGQPRQWNYPTGYNLQGSPQRGNGRIAFDTLRSVIDSYDIAQIVINHRIDDLRSLDTRIVAAKGVDVDVAGAVRLGEAALYRPDGQHLFKTWLAMWLQDLLRYDAGTLYRRRDRANRVIGLDVVDGTTIAPALDYWGRRPTGDATAYVQFVQGTPWKHFKASDLIYEPFRPFSNSPYGMSPMESLLVTANTDLRFQLHFLNWFTEGSVPEGFAIAPEGMTEPDQVRQFQQFWDALMVGDEAAKDQVKWVPHGVTFEWPNEKGFDSAFPLYLMRKVCAAYHVVPNDLGFTEDVNRATGETQVDVQFRIGTKPLAEHVKMILDDYLQHDLGLPVEFEFDLGEDSQERLAVAQADKLYVDMGAISVDEVRGRVFGLPVDNERPVPRYINNERLGPTPLAALFSVAGPVDQDTLAPTDDVPLSTTRFTGTPSLLPVKAPGEANFHQAPTNPDDPRRPGLEKPVPGTDVVAPPAPAGAAAALPPKSLNTVRLSRDVQGTRLSGGDDGGQHSVVLKADGPEAAGLCVRAADTGRVLLLQRGLDPDDDAAGCWEFPGGHIEPGDVSPLNAARREWMEETGMVTPPGELVGQWTSGVYQGFVWLIQSEAALPINRGDAIVNPDDPDGDNVETVAWFDPDDLPDMPSLRPELADSAPWKEVAGTDRMVKALRKWRDNTRTRVGRGQLPRTFTSPDLPVPVVKAVWPHLQTARDRSAVDAVFDTVIEAVVSGPKAPAHREVRKGWRDRPVNAQPQHDIDLQIIDEWTPRIADALRRVFTRTVLRSMVRASVHRVRKDEAASDDEITGTGSDVGLSIRDIMNGVDTTPLETAVTQLWFDAYVRGAAAATVQLDVRNVLNLQAAPGLLRDYTDWSKWRPGDPIAADKLRNGGLAQLMADANVRFTGIARTSAQGIADTISDGLSVGDSIDAITTAVFNYADGFDMARAELVAVTETARAVTAATMDTYTANGIEQWDLVTSVGACQICLDVEAANPHSVDGGDQQPPLHPRCRCAASPVVAGVSEDGSGDSTAADTTPTADGSTVSADTGSSMMDALRTNGGFTIDARTGASPTDGYQVGIDGHTMQVDGQIPTIDQLNNMSAEELAGHVEKWMGDNADLFDKPNMMVGGWHDTSTGLVHFDVSEHVPTLDQAVQLGQERNQIAVWDNANAAEIATGGEGDDSGG